MAFFKTTIALAALVFQSQAQSPLTVDLGYAKYVGTANSTNKVNTWKGIHYAAAPVGDLRFAAPKEPAVTGQTIQANTDGPSCYQSYFAIKVNPVPRNESEDCLVLNVWAPENAANLPVYVVIHGGGYGLGALYDDDPTALITTSGNQPFIGVGIQYRLGAFGFLSSQDVKQAGALNAGLLDQQLALKWVQKYIHLFGGDPSRVTIAGESAGGGSVMLHAMAYNGTQKPSLFRYGVAQSPYLPKQYTYNDAFPTSQYDKFVAAAGCSEISGNKIACLRGKPIKTVAAASNNVSMDGIYGTWAFTPVTDGTLVQNVPTKQLLQNYPVNGEKLWVGSVADEGARFVSQNHSTAADLDSYIRTTLPNFTDADIKELLALYAPSDYAKNPNNPLFASSGTGIPSALDVNPISIGPQQTVNLIYGEIAFICPTYWLATAYSRSSRVAYHYQYSIPFARHGTDLAGYYGPQSENQSNDFVYAWRRMFGKFISEGNLNVGNAVGNGISTNNNSANALSNYPVWADGKKMVNFNESGGTPYRAEIGSNLGFTTQLREPGLKNDYRVVDSVAWEQGRGHRCDWWAKKAAKVPF